MDDSAVPEKCRCGESLADRSTRINGSKPMCDACVSKFIQAMVDANADQYEAKITEQQQRIEALEGSLKSVIGLFEDILWKHLGKPLPESNAKEILDYAKALLGGKEK